MKRPFVLLLVIVLVFVGITTLVSAWMISSNELIAPFYPVDNSPAAEGMNPLVMGLFFLCLTIGEVTVGTLLLQYFGKRRAYDVGIVPIELEEDELEKLFEEFMSAP